MLPIALGGLHDSMGGYGAGLSLVGARRAGGVHRRRRAAPGVAPRLGRRRSARVMVKTGCPYCGVGCGLVAEVRDGRLHAVRGDEEHPVNRGLTCRKPLALPEASRSADRALRPLVRGRAGRALPRGDVGRRARRRRLAAAGDPRRARPGLDRVLHLRPAADRGLLRGQQARQGLPGDQQRRLQLAAVHVVGGRGATTPTFGADGPPPAYADLELTDCILLLGSNASACHPILWGRIRDGAGARREADRRRSAAHGHRGGGRHPPADPPGHRPGAAQRADRGARAGGRRGRRSAPPRRAAWPRPTSRAPPRAFADAGASMALWSMGANQSVEGVAINRALLNLCVVTGQIGRPGAGPLSLTGQPNAMGGRETGGLAHLLPGYRKVVRDGPPRGGRGALGAARRVDLARRPGCPRPTCSRRWRTAASRRSGSAAPTPPSRCRTPSGRARRCAAPSS